MSTRVKLANLLKIKWPSRSIANSHVRREIVILSCHFKNILENNFVPFELTPANLWSFARRWKCPRIKARETWVCRKHPEFCQHYNYCQAPGGIGKEGSVAIFLKGYKYCHIQLGWYKGWFFDFIHDEKLCTFWHNFEMFCSNIVSLHICTCRFGSFNLRHPRDPF